MVASWAEVASIVRASFEVVIEGEDWLGLLHRPEDERPPVKVKVSALAALGRTFVACTADVLGMADLPTELALALNHALPIGALELEEGRYLLRATLPMLGLDPVYLRRVVLHVGRQAAHMQHRRATHQEPQVFLHWAE